MTKFRAIIIEYGEPLPLGIGAYDHPAGGASCALQVNNIAEFETEAEAFAYGIEMEAEPAVHEAIIQEI